MSIVVVGVNHRTAPLAVLERLAITPDEVAKAVVGLAQRDNIREVAVLATCGRTELYLVAERFHGAFADATEFLGVLSSMAVDELAPYLYSQHDDAAVTHLFEVAAGLDSAVLGESEILGQVRTAWRVGQANGGVRATLDLLFRRAMRTGKRARTETAIGRGTTSISHAAVEMARDRLGSLAGRRVLVVGAGEMGRGVSVALRGAGAGTIVVANRTPARGAGLAADVGGVVAGFDELTAELSACDVVVTCASGETHVTVDHLAGRPVDASPLLVVDIAVPRNVEPAINELPGVTVLDLDDLRDWADRGLAARAADADRVREIVAEELDRFVTDSLGRLAAPLIADLHARAESIRSAETLRYSGRLADLDDEQRDAVEALTKAIVAKLLHAPSVRLRQDAGTPQGERIAATVSDLFELGR
jgi:glutamyl-tRNA reductase